MNCQLSQSISHHLTFNLTTKYEIFLFYDEYFKEFGLERGISVEETNAHHISQNRFKSEKAKQDFDYSEQKYYANFWEQLKDQLGELPEASVFEEDEWEL